MSKSRRKYQSRIRVKNGGVTPSFTQIEDHVLEDHRINATAFRMFVYIKSKKDDWDFYREDIEKRLGIGETAYRTARKQLYKYGYIEYRGHSEGTDFVYYERPDKNKFYLNGINRNGEREVEFTDFLLEIQKEEKKVASAGEPKKTKSDDKTKTSNNNVSSNGRKASENNKKFVDTNTAEHHDIIDPFYEDY